MDYKDTLNLPRTDFPMKADLVRREPERLARWEAARLYDRIQAARAGAPAFVLHDGPPFANGEIHLGHVLNKILKDIVIKYKTLRGCRAPYVPGWDCHGLPIEFQVTQELRKDRKPDAGAQTPDARPQMADSGGEASAPGTPHPHPAPRIRHPSFPPWPSGGLARLTRASTWRSSASSSNGSACWATGTTRT
jgi:leucyl-tRNA synthetase